MGKKTEKGKSGEAVQYFSRKKALHYLQVSLPNFTRLCLWKGIYPSQPKNLRAVNKGDSTPKTYYKKTDILILLRDPIISKLRIQRTFNMKIKRARERADRDKLFRLLKHKPKVDLSRLVHERYPTLEAALTNLEDPIYTIMIIASLPRSTQYPEKVLLMCRRFKLELLNYIIATRAVRLAFISMKAIYVDVNLGGVDVRCRFPHTHGGSHPYYGLNMRSLAASAEFDCIMLGNVLCQLYRQTGLHYPPRFNKVRQCGEQVNEVSPEYSDTEMLTALSFAMELAVNDSAADAAREGKSAEDVEMDEQLHALDENLASYAAAEARVAAVQQLFVGQKVFLSREVPRDVLCVLLSSCGAKVSWDESVMVGASFVETDEDITLCIADRPVSDPVVTRSYVIPQYVVDSINARRRLPVSDYIPGAQKIFHVNPYLGNLDGAAPSNVYEAPEYRYLRGEITSENLYKDHEMKDIFEDDEEEEEDKLEGKEEMEDIFQDEEDEVEEKIEKKQLKKPKKTLEEYETEILEDMLKKDKPVKAQKKPIKKNVKRIPKEEMNIEVQKNMDRKTQEMNIPKKRKNLYNKMKHAEKASIRTVENFKTKRQEANKSMAKGKNK